MNQNVKLIHIETRIEQVKIRLEDQIKSIRQSLDGLEDVLTNDKSVYKSLGLQGAGDQLDNYIYELAALEEMLKLISK